MVKPALRRAWRSLRSVQFGVTPAHAVVLDPVDGATGTLLGLLDGTRGTELLRAEARTLGLPSGRLDALLGRLESAGLLADAATGRPGRAGPAAGAVDSALDPLRADLASLSVVHPEPERAVRTLAARRAARVQVRGAGRVGAMVAALLAAAGTGSVEVVDSGRVEAWETAPGGLPAEAVGERRATAARRLVNRWRRARVPGRPGEGSGGVGLSLVVVTPGRSRRVRPRSASGSAVGHHGDPASVRRGPGGDGSRRAARPAGRHGVRAVPSGGADGPGVGLAAAARPVALRGPASPARLRPGARDGGGRSRRRARAGLPRRGSAGQHR